MILSWWVFHIAMKKHLLDCSRAFDAFGIPWTPSELQMMSFPPPTPEATTEMMAVLHQSNCEEDTFRPFQLS